MHAWVPLQPTLTGTRPHQPCATSSGTALPGPAHGSRWISASATSSESLTARYFSESADHDPRAEGRDALAQPDWGSCIRPLCRGRHQEFVVLAPPHTLVARALRKAQCGEAAGVLVTPNQVEAAGLPGRVLVTP